MISVQNSYSLQSDDVSDWPFRNKFPAEPLLANSGVQDKDFGVHSGRILRIFWIGCPFPFNRIRIIQIKLICSHVKKTWYGLIVASGKITIFRNHISSNPLF